MSGFFSRLFGGGGGEKAPAAEPVMHEGFAIFPEPMAEGGQFRISARIEKEIGGETRIHRMIRADLLNDRDAAVAATLAKARALVDQQGDDIFG